MRRIFFLTVYSYIVHKTYILQTYGYTNPINLKNLLTKIVAWQTLHCIKYQNMYPGNPIAVCFLTLLPALLCTRTSMYTLYVKYCPSLPKDCKHFCFHMFLSQYVFFVLLLWVPIRFKGDTIVSVPFLKLNIVTAICLMVLYVMHGYVLFSCTPL